MCPCRSCRVMEVSALDGRLAGPSICGGACRCPAHLLDADVLDLVRKLQRGAEQVIRAIMLEDSLCLLYMDYGEESTSCDGTDLRAAPSDDAAVHSAEHDVAGVTDQQYPRLDRRHLQSHGALIHAIPPAQGMQLIPVVDAAPGGKGRFDHHPVVEAVVQDEDRHCIGPA